MDKLLDLFKKFEKSKLSKEQSCLVSGGSFVGTGILAAGGTCDGHSCCKETAQSDNRTSSCTGDKNDGDDGADLCV